MNRTLNAAKMTTLLITLAMAGCQAGVEWTNEASSCDEDELDWDKSENALSDLHAWAAAVEQNVVFGTHDEVLESLVGAPSHLSEWEIRQIADGLLAGSSTSMTSAEISRLAVLQQGRDLYATLRSIVMAAHQRTGALSGRVGVHLRIAADTEPNRDVNLRELMMVLSNVQPGNRIVLMDTVQANGDPSVFSDDPICDSGGNYDEWRLSRMGLVANHAWGLQRLVRTIRDHGYQDRVILILRIDHSQGCAPNVSDSASMEMYRQAVLRQVHCLEQLAPFIVFRIALGNEPDLIENHHGWAPDAGNSDLDWLLGSFARPMGDFMVSIAQERPDVTFIAPALSANLKHEYVAYYTTMFGGQRPWNIAVGLHGYSVDIGGPDSVMWGQVDALHNAGFPWVSATEFGPGGENPVGAVMNIAVGTGMADAVTWIMLSENHDSSGQDNAWSFTIAENDHGAAQHFVTNHVNGTRHVVCANITERGNDWLQVMSGCP